MATGNGPCLSPLFNGTWTGSWTSAIVPPGPPTGGTGGGGGGHPGTPLSGTWHADFKWTDANTLNAVFSMSTSAGAQIFTTLAEPGTCAVLTNGVEAVDFGLGGTVDFDGALSTDGKSLTNGAYTKNGDHGSFSGTFATALPNGVTVACAAPASCLAAVSTVATIHAPSETVSVTAPPSDPTGVVNLSVTPGSLPAAAVRADVARVVSGCPKLPAGFARVGNLTDTGFASTTSVAVTVTLHRAAESSPAGVCFNSDVPFLSQANPKVAKAGTGVLLTCVVTANVTPCVVSSKQVGSDFVVNFVVPGGDPKFVIFPAKGQVAFAAGTSSARVGQPYSLQMASSGGKAPVHWKIKSGNTPPGVALNAATGAIKGTPTATGTSKFVVQGTDSAVPKADVAVLGLKITVS